MSTSQAAQAVVHHDPMAWVKDSGEDEWKPQSSPLLAFPMMMVQLALASWETIGYRIALIAQGACTVSEYRLMASEKVEALQLSTLALLAGCSQDEIVKPYLQRAQSNASRLRTVSQ